MKISFASAVPAGVPTVVLGLSSDDPAAQLLVVAAVSISSRLSPRPQTAPNYAAISTPL